jgi:hypothetical protein
MTMRVLFLTVLLALSACVNGQIGTPPSARANPYDVPSCGTGNNRGCGG